MAIYLKKKSADRFCYIVPLFLKNKWFHKHLSLTWQLERDKYIYK